MCSDVCVCVCVHVVCECACGVCVCACVVLVRVCTCMHALHAMCIFVLTISSLFHTRSSTSWQ